MRWLLGALAAAIVVLGGLACRAEVKQAPQGQAQQRAADPYAALRNAMVDELIRRGYVHDRRVIEALREVPRHVFVPPEYRSQAYVDTPLPIGFGQTISAPSIVAMMTELLKPDPEDKVLEIGTGSGYQAAVLAKLVKHVYTIEIIPELAEAARKRLKELGFDNVTVKCGDGYQGWPEHAPFDGIIVTCAPTKIPQPLVDQLKEGGRMVVPVGPQWHQELYLLEKVHGQIKRRAIIPVLFVPMTGKAAGEAE